MSYYASLGDIILGGDFNSGLGYRFKEMSYCASLGDIILGGDFNSGLGYRFKEMSYYASLGDIILSGDFNSGLGYRFKEMSYYASLGDIILGGDFNSGLGYRFKDYILKDLNGFLPIDQSFQIDYDNFRKSHDKKITVKESTSLNYVSHITLRYLWKNCWRYDWKK